jgi:hypothetical protein
LQVEPFLVFIQETIYIEVCQEKQVCIMQPRCASVVRMIWYKCRMKLKYVQ